MQRWILPALLLVAAAASHQAVFSLNRSQQSSLPDYGPAPEFHDSVWLNTDRVLRLQDLRGQVVLLEMWTFGCINCINTLPYLRQWHENYGDQGLVVIGNHYPEFSYERDLNNVKDSLIRLEIAYPVIQDNERETWSAYNNRYWPTIYLIDKQGHIRYRHIGEGRYRETEAAIQTLLAEEFIPDADLVSESLTSLSAVDLLNVRSGPGIDFERIGSIAPGEVYAVHETLPGWYRINYQGRQGYVSADYVALS
jgi:thiol-disulfide isomerase/thioredoxin